LEAVMEDCPPVDETLCLGDVVGYGGDPKRCVDEVMDNGWLTLVGNHDRACTDPEILEWFNDDAATVVRWTVDVIGPERLEWLRDLPDSHTKENVLLVHASPRSHLRIRPRQRGRACKPRAAARQAVPSRPHAR